MKVARVNSKGVDFTPLEMFDSAQATRRVNTYTIMHLLKYMKDYFY
jgi:hypothetical protein